MSGPRQTTVRRTAILGGALLVLAGLMLVGADLALRLAPAVVLVALVAVGWMPGEERLVRAMRRRAARGATGPAPRILQRAPRIVAVHDRLQVGSRTPRGPPRLLVA